MQLAFASLLRDQLDEAQIKRIGQLTESFLQQHPKARGIFALHYHWVLASEIKNSFPSGKDLNEVKPKVAALHIFQASFRLLSVWYALLYVVVEGYNELGLADERIDSLLQQKSYVEQLRRFRNSLFHFQHEVESSKYSDFLLEDESENWARNLNQAFGCFFKSSLPVEEIAMAVLSK